MSQVSMNELNPGSRLPVLDHWINVGFLVPIRIAASDAGCPVCDHRGLSRGRFRRLSSPRYSLRRVAAPAGPFPAFRITIH